MAWTAPRTWTTGELVTAAQFNEQIRDNELWLARDKPHCRVTRATNLSIANATNTVVGGLTSESFDVGGMHSTVTNTSRITIPTGGAGRYHFGANVEWVSNGTGRRQLHILLNATTTIAQVNDVAGAATPHGQQVMGFFDLAAADFLELFVFQSSGGALDVQASSNYSPIFWASWYAFSGG